MTRSGWCLPSSGRNCHDHAECERRGVRCGCPDHDKPKEEKRSA